MTGLEVRRAGRVVLVQDCGVMQGWLVDEWAELVAAIKSGAAHDGIDRDPVLPLAIFGLDRHEPMYVDLDDWRPFVAGVKAGKFDIDKLSSGDADGSVSADGAVRVVAGAGKAGNPPSAPAATAVSGPNVAAMDVPAGRPTPAPAQVALPQEAGRPGLVITDEAVIAAAQILKANAESHGVTTTVHTMRLWARAALAAALPHLVDSEPRWGSGPLVNHVDSESSRIGVAAGGGEAGPGSLPVGPGPAEPVSRTVFDEGGCDCGCEDAS